MYRYRTAAMPTSEQRLRCQAYDRLYQRMEDDTGIPWTPGMYFPKTAMEAGVLPRDAKILSDALDVYMCALMFTVQAAWERRKRGRA